MCLRILDRDVCKAVSAVFFHRERVVAGEGRFDPSAGRDARSDPSRPTPRPFAPSHPDHASSSRSASSSLSSCSASFIPTTASSSVRVASATAPAYSASVGSGGADPPAARHPHPKECVAHLRRKLPLANPGREMSAGASGMGAAACAAAAAATASSSSSSPPLPSPSALRGGFSEHLQGARHVELGLLAHLHDANGRGGGFFARREERLLHGDRLQGPRAHLGRDLAAERVVASAAERAVHESSEAVVEASVEARARLLHAEEASDELSRGTAHLWKRRSRAPILRLLLRVPGSR